MTHQIRVISCEQQKFFVPSRPRAPQTFLSSLSTSPSLFSVCLSVSLSVCLSLSLSLCPLPPSLPPPSLSPPSSPWFVQTRTGSPRQMCDDGLSWSGSIFEPLVRMTTRRRTAARDCHLRPQTLQETACSETRGSKPLNQGRPPRTPWIQAAPTRCQKSAVCPDRFASTAPRTTACENERT